MRELKRFRAAVVLLAGLSFICCGARAADEPRADEILPDTTVAAILIPDLSQARAAFAKTPFSGMTGQPEMQAFLRPAFDEMTAQYSKLQAANPLLPTLADLDAGLASGEVAISIYSRPGGKESPLGIAVILRPKDTEAFKRAIPEPLRQKVVEGFMQPLGGRPTDPAIAFSGGRLIVCAPHGDMQSLLARVKDPAARTKGSLASSKPYVEPREKLARSAAAFYLTLKSSPDALTDIVKFIEGGFGGRRGPNDREVMMHAAQVQSIMDVVGFEHLLSMSMGLEFTEGGAAIHSVLATEGPLNSGLVALLIPTEPPSAEAMKIAPAGSPYVGTSTFHIAKLLPAIEQIVRTFSPGAVGELNKGLALVNQKAQFDLQKDLLANIGSSIVVAQTVHDTAPPLSWVPGMVMSVDIKDPAKVEDSLAKGATALEKLYFELQETMNSPIVPAIRPKKTVHRGKTIYFLSGNVFAGPGALSLVGNRMVFGTSLNAVKRGIEQLEAPDSILDNKSFQETIARLTGKPFDPKALPLGFAYSIDVGSGGGALFATGLGLTVGTAALAGIAEIPAPRGGMAAANPGNSIPKNESEAGRACMTYAEAQDIYRRTDWNKNGVLEYAQSIGGDNSLLETKAGAGDIALVDRAFAEAEGNPGGKGNRRGYRFKILKGQTTPPARSFLNPAGAMTTGYALVAYPVEYGVTGKRTFQISNAGTVYAKDLGADTDAAVAKLDAFGTEGWEVVDDPMAEEQPQHRHGGDEFAQFLARPSGKTVLAVANAVDLNLWPDEAFFIKHRRPVGGLLVVGPNGLHSRSDFPPPGPVDSSSLSPMVVVAVVAGIAAIAIPNLLRSRMAANETAAAAHCKAYAEAQDIYRRTDWDKDGVLEYAQSIGDEKGESLYFSAKAGQVISLVDQSFARAEVRPGAGIPKAGYCYKILTSENIEGKKRNYINNGNMTSGYALFAYPIQYDGTGRNCFMISNMGTIYQADLGPLTAEDVAKITEFNPEAPTWIVTE